MLCCCGGAAPWHGVILTAYLEDWNRTVSATLRTGPVLPSEAVGDPTCTPPDVAFGRAGCTDEHSVPEYTEVECPGDPENVALIRLGTETHDTCVQNLYAALVIGVPYDRTETTTIGTTLWWREPPGGGTPEVIAAGVSAHDSDVFEHSADLQYPGLYGTDCIHRGGKPVPTFIRATWRERSRWTTPPSAMDLLATASGWTIEVTATELILTKPGPVVATFTLAGQDFGDLQTWLNTRGVNTYRYTGASGALTATLAHPATMLQAFAATSVPTSGAKMRLPLTAVDAPVVHDGSHDEDAHPGWQLQSWTAWTGSSGTVDNSSGIALVDFAGTEAEFAGGARADYEATVGSGAWGAVTGEALEAATVGGSAYVLVPDYGNLYGGSRFIPASGAAPYEHASSVTESTSASWQGLFDCWAHCSASRSKSGSGQVMAWQLQRV